MKDKNQPKKYLGCLLPHFTEVPENYVPVFPIQKMYSFMEFRQ